MDDLQYGAYADDLEVRVRDGGARLKGSFPYNRRAVLSDGGRRGRPQKEEFASRAFSFAVENREREIHLLVGHSFDRPLARKLDGSLTLRDTDRALEFEATIAAGMRDVSYVRDALAMLSAGLAVGVSPGFRLPPERAVPRDDAEEITEEPINPEAGEHGALIRTIRQAILFEISVVTRPVYEDAQVEARAQQWRAAADSRQFNHVRRWRP
ncbi:MAG: HK97 family phage prohead protease [Pseudomonadota bacterium]